MAKVFTKEEIAELRKNNATIVREKRHIEIDNLSSAVEAMRQVAFDAAQLQQQNTQTLLAGIDRLAMEVANKDTGLDDLRPILDQLIELQRLALQPRPSPEYVFDIQRNSRQYMTQVTARPAKEKLQ